MKKLLILCIGIMISISGCYQQSVVETEQKLPESEKEVVSERHPTRFTIVAVGDIMLARGVGGWIRRNSVNYPFEHTREIISGGDIAFGNLETTLATSGTKLPGKGIWFRAVPEAAQGLKNAGFDILSLANNHILDYDTPALMETIETLERWHLGNVGAGENLKKARQPLMIIENGMKVGFLAYNEFYNYYYSYFYKRNFEATDVQAGTAPMKEELIEEDVKRLREICDIVVVSLHWGTEDSNNTNNNQKELAHKIIDWGADVILGHHPHVLQGLEFYKGKPIAYSLGNFVFDQNDENNKQSIILEIVFEDNYVNQVSATPVYIVNKSQPVVPEDWRKEYIIDKIIKLSNKMGTKGLKKEDRAVFISR